MVTISEFGRRVQENASGGTDHGYGNVMFLAGAGVKGGKYYGTWPGLSNTLDGDLLVTTDYRSVLSEVVVSRFGASPAAVFPGFVRGPVGSDARAAERPSAARLSVDDGERGWGVWRGRSGRAA